MSKWTESNIFQKVAGKSGLTRFVGWFNNLLNPGHDWMDYSSAPDQGEGLFNSVKNQVTQEHMTGADVEANEMTMQNMEDQYQRQVTGMQKAGLNPALMYQSGASGSTPQAQNTGNGVSMSELMQLMLMPLQKKALQAQISNTDAKTDRERAEIKLTEARTENMSLVNKYYPQATEASISKLLSGVNVDLATVDQKEAETALTRVKETLANKENQYADRFFKARADYEEAKTTQAKAAAARDAAEAAISAMEKEQGYRLGSSGWIAIAAALSENFDVGNPEVGDAIKDGLHPFGTVDANARGKVVDAGKDVVKRAGKKVKRVVDRFERWRNRPKKAPWVK